MTSRNSIYISLIVIKFEENDDFGDVLAIIQDRTNILNGILSIPCPAKNDPGALFPVTSWPDIHDVYETFESCRIERQFSFDVRYSQQGDFIWV
jgi:hypothetical protein